MIQHATIGPCGSNRDHSNKVISVTSFYKKTSIEQLNTSSHAESNKSNSCRNNNTLNDCRKQLTKHLTKQPHQEEHQTKTAFQSDFKNLDMITTYANAASYLFSALIDVYVVYLSSSNLNHNNNNSLTSVTSSAGPVSVEQKWIESMMNTTRRIANVSFWSILQHGLLMFFIIWFIVTPLISLRDCGFHAGTSLHYRIQTKHIVGMILYSVSLTLLSLCYYDHNMDGTGLSNTREEYYPTFLPTTNNSTHIMAMLSDLVAYDASDSISIPENESSTFWSSFLLSLRQNDTYKQTLAIGLIIAYHAFEMIYTAAFCSNFYIENRNNDWEKIEQILYLPIISICLLLFHLYETTSSTFRFAYSTLSLVIVYKMVRLMIQYIDCSDPEGTVSSDMNNTIPTIKKTNGTKVPTSNNVWRIYGNEYDVTDFVQKHPGGVEAIMLGANRIDCTALFQSYHPFTIHKARQVLEKYRINNKYKKDEDAAEVLSGAETTSTTTTTTTTTDNTKTIPVPSQQRFVHENDKFYSILCERVATVLEEKVGLKVRIGKSICSDPIRATTGRYITYGLYIVAFVLSCYAHCKGYLLGSFFAGVLGWLVGGIGHDGGHFAISTNPLINDTALWCISCLMNPIMWQHNHTFAHHSHTNEMNCDPDLNFDDLLRFVTVATAIPETKNNNNNTSSSSSSSSSNSNKQTKTIDCNEVPKTNTNQTESTAPVAMYKFQSNPMYVVFIFSIICLATCYTGVVKFIVDREQNQYCTWTDRQRPLRTIGMFVHLFIHWYIFWFVPFRVHHDSWYKIALACFIPIMTSSLLFGFFSQVGHINESSFHRRCDYYRNKRHRIAQQSWAADQIESTNDFCPQDTIIFYISNGLNMQIEHHLFPSLNHCHLKHIQPIVERTCYEYNVSYKKYHTWYDAMIDTLKHLHIIATTTTTTAATTQ